MTKPKASRNASRAKACASAPVPAPAPARPKEWTLEMPPDAPGRAHGQLMAQGAADGIVGNARSLVDFGRGTFGELSLSDCAKVLKGTAQGLNDGDLSAAVTMLSSQAVALNAMFGELARRSALNMGKYLDASERYLRLALKAQGQCRATLEALAEIKNPRPFAFVKQANISGGHQQVNNGPTPSEGVNPAQARASARPGEPVSAPNELLEDRTHGRTQLDTRATAAAGRAHQGLEPVGEVNRTA